MTFTLRNAFQIELETAIDINKRCLICYLCKLLCNCAEFAEEISVSVGFSHKEILIQRHDVHRFIATK